MDGMCGFRGCDWGSEVCGGVVVLGVRRQAENFREGGLGRMGRQGHGKGGGVEESKGPRPRRGAAEVAFLRFRDLVS